MATVGQQVSAHESCLAKYGPYTPYTYQGSFGKYLFRWGTYKYGWAWCLMLNGGREILAFGEVDSESEVRGAANRAAEKLEAK